jgi:hypothetical protein
VSSHCTPARCCASGGPHRSIFCTKHNLILVPRSPRQAVQQLMKKQMFTGNVYFQRRKPDSGTRVGSDNNRAELVSLPSGSATKHRGLRSSPGNAPPSRLFMTSYHGTYSSTQYSRTYTCARRATAQQAGNSETHRCRGRSQLSTRQAAQSRLAWRLPITRLPSSRVNAVVLLRGHCDDCNRASIASAHRLADWCRGQGAPAW